MKNKSWYITLALIHFFIGCRLPIPNQNSNSDLVGAGLAVVASNAQANVSSTYPSSTAFTFTTGQNISLSPSQHVNGSTYTISISLPSGINFNSSTGVLSGIPTTTVPMTTFTITQTQPNGTKVTWSLSIEIKSNSSAESTTSTTTTSTTVPITNHTVGGTLSGNLNGGTVVFQLNGANNLSRSALGSFTFGTTLSTNNTYSVTVFSQPSQSTFTTCGITGNGSGTIASSNISNVLAACSPCGDGVLTSYQTCDDGNSADGDGCSRYCVIESGFSCSGAPSICSN